MYLFCDINVPRPDDASSFEEQSSDHTIDEPPMSYHEELDQPVLEPLSANNTSNSYSAFPPSFNEMLTNCSIDYDQGELISKKDLHWNTISVFWFCWSISLLIQCKSDTEEPCPLAASNHAFQEVMLYLFESHANSCCQECYWYF